jgi:hypothetical protein
VDDYFCTFTTAKLYIAVVVLDAKGDLQLKGIAGHSALNDGLGIIGSRSLYTLPSCIEEVVPAFTDCTRQNTGPNPAESGFFWEAATVALGNMMEAFLSPQTPIEPRDFAKVNRTFITREPYSLTTQSPGLRLSLPQEECSWPRVDCLRFRYHPCFRLPTDPIHPGQPDSLQIYAVENGLVVSSSSGVTLILIYTGDTYRTFIEYTSKPEREVMIQEEFLRSKLPDVPKNAPITLKIFSASQGETVVEDFQAARNMKVQLPKGHGTAYMSAVFGAATPDSQSQEVILQSITTGSLLTGIRVFHNSTGLEGLEFLYEDTSSQLFGSRGGSCSTTTEDAKTSDFALDARKGEVLMGFCVRAQMFVDGIEILTSFGRKSSIFGNPQGGSMYA